MLRLALRPLRIRLQASHLRRLRAPLALYRNMDNVEVLATRECHLVLLVLTQREAYTMIPGDRQVAFLD